MSNIDPRDLVRLGAAYMKGGVVADEEDEYEGCSNDYPEHRTRDTYVGEDGIQWECTRCGAEDWEPAEGAA